MDENESNKDIDTIARIQTSPKQQNKRFLIFLLVLNL